MITFRVLCARNALDAETWDALIKQLPPERRDVHFTSAYGRVQEALGGTAILAVAQDSESGAFIAQSFVWRTVPGRIQGYWDLCSPYGYGGPFSNGDDGTTDAAEPILVRTFYDQLRYWCSVNMVVSEFCYLHPMFSTHQNYLLPDQELRAVKHVVVINLQDMTLEGMSRTVRRGVKHAIANDAIAIELQDQPAARKSFANLYQRSMENKNAEQRWRFPKEYLEAHFEELPVRIYYANDESGGRRELMVVHDHFTAYAHLFGSNGLSKDNGLDQFLYYNAARNLQLNGFSNFHLGGGLTGDNKDPLLMFKSGFAKPEHLLFSYKRIFNQTQYDTLTNKKIDEEIAAHGRVSNSNFFPAYRREWT